MRSYLFDDMLPHQILVAGEFRDAALNRTFDVVDPGSLETVATIPDATAEDAIAAMEACAAAAAPLARVSTRARADFLDSLYRAVMDRQEAFAQLITVECGKPITESRAEVAYGADYIRWFAGEALRQPGLVRPAPAGHTQIVVSKPVGPAYLITPWNFPLAMATRKFAPAIAAGCPVVIKPAQLTPLTTLAFARLATDLGSQFGLPAGFLNVLTGTSSSALSAPILSDSRLRKLSFTGSTEVGRTLLAQAAPSVLRTSMELGGNAPFLVFEDADIDAAVAGAMAAKMRNAGQTCVAANRFLVHRSVAEEFTNGLRAAFAALVVGHGLDESVTVGPLINDDARASSEQLVDAAVSSGADLAFEGSVPSALRGHFTAPVVLANVPHTSPIVGTEIFGPVAPIVVFDSEDEAIKIANGTPFGLVAYAYTRDLERARRLTTGLEVGMIGLNRGMVSDATAPFGGLKASGLGKEGGDMGLAEYLATTYVAF